MDAEKMKKKLHGSILKGTKVRVEGARPAKDLTPREDTEPERPRKQRKDSSKKRKRGEETIPAVEIGERHVKRGWTVPASAKGKVNKRGDKQSKERQRQINKSKYTTGPECLFKTVLPANVAADPKSNAHVKLGKRKRGKGKEAVVHEFSQSTKHATFLRGSAGKEERKAVREYVEGKGWVDEEGNVVGEERPRKRAKVTELESIRDDHGNEEEIEEGPSVGDVAKHPAKAISSEVELGVPDPSSSTSSSSEASSASDSEDDSDGEAIATTTPSKLPNTIKPSRLPPLDTKSTSPTLKRPGSSNPSSGLSIKIPSPIFQKPIHPLEALYKRSAPSSESKGAAAASGGFSFFGADGDGDGDEDGGEERDSLMPMPMPMTPFTQKEFEFRGMRSAAPTPDTAFVDRRFEWPVGSTSNQSEHGDEQEQYREESSPIPDKKGKGKGKEKDAGADEGKGEESEFKQWFYAHRGETTRAWKKRRRVAAKEKRQRENRRRN